MYIIIRILRFLTMALCFVLFFVFAFFIHFTTVNPVKRRKKFVKNCSRFARFGLWVCRIKVISKNKPPLEKTHLIVSNHTGFFDIIVMITQVPTLFVTSVEMREAPVLGLLTEMSGCLYVERRSRENIPNEIKEIENALNEGFNVVIYPEGTSTNGERILPFKKSLLTSCANSDANILPAVLNFREVNGEKMQHKFRDWLFWYGNQSFPWSLWQSTNIKSCIAEIEFLNEISVNNPDQRRVVAEQAYMEIESRFEKIPLPT
jgi:lyso-ornithine lipid O-acyltransferase